MSEQYETPQRNDYIHVRALAVLGSSTKVQSSATLQYRFAQAWYAGKQMDRSSVVAYHYIKIHIEIHRVSALRRLFRIFQQLRPFRINKLIVHSHPICICISELTVSKIRIWQNETKKKSWCFNLVPNIFKITICFICRVHTSKQIYV